MPTVEGVYLDGAYVNSLEDKHFSIVKVPEYREFQSLDNSELKKRKMVLTIELADGTNIEYLPNKTSIKEIIKVKGYDYNNYNGFEGEFKVVDQKVGKDMKKVIYIVETVPVVTEKVK